VYVYVFDAPTDVGCCLDDRKALSPDYSLARCEEFKVRQFMFCSSLHPFPLVK
jgi:hypothetical protein